MVLISDGEYQYEYDDFAKAFPASPNGSSLNSSDLIDNMTPRSAAETKAQQTQGVGSIAGASLTVGSGEPPPPVSATPPTVTPPPAPTKSPVKIATPQYVKFDRDKYGDAESDQDFIKLIFFEQINGVALLSLTNSAKLDTGTISYQPIANMAETIKALNPKNIVALQDTSDKYFLNFPIKLETKIPNVGNGPDGTNVYREDQAGRVLTISNRSLTSNVATLTTTSIHSLEINTLIEISGINSTFNGTYTIVGVPTTNTFTYAKTATDVPSVASIGTATLIDPKKGQIIIEAINLGPRENIQIETLQSGTIYKTNLGNEES